MALNYSWLLERSFVISWILFITIFYVSSIAGSIFYHVLPVELKEQISSWIRSYYESRIPHGAFNPLTLLVIILVNNSVVAILTWLLSITIVFPLIVMTVNGLLVGFITTLVVVSQTFSSYTTIFLSLAPHGVIEIPALALVASAFTLIFIRGFSEFLSAMPGILVLALIMIAIAALVESTVTVIAASAVELAILLASSLIG